MERTHGYARVSTKEQNVERQVIALLAWGVPEEDILVEKKSGKDFERPIYMEMVNKLKPGDILVIKSIDRLGRDYDEIIEQWRLITKNICADIVVLDMPLLDTRNRGQNLTASLVTDLVLQILSYVAQTEREFCLQRQSEGIAAAKARGVKFGRKPKKFPDTFDDVMLLHAEGKITAKEAAKKLGVSRPTFMKWKDGVEIKQCCACKAKQDGVILAQNSTRA